MTAIPSLQLIELELECLKTTEKYFSDQRAYLSTLKVYPSSLLGIRRSHSTPDFKYGRCQISNKESQMTRKALFELLRNNENYIQERVKELESIKREHYPSPPQFSSQPPAQHKMWVLK